MLSKKQDRRTALCALFLAAAITLLAIFDYLAACGEVRTEVVRLHIIANSDSDADQEVKLLVRDRLLNDASLLCGGADTAQQAAAMLQDGLPAIADAANEVLRQNGFDYGARAELTTAYFDTRAYGGFTLPAGKYKALRVVLGEGEGKNWWCVMFPPLCLPAAQENAMSAEAVFSGSKWQAVAPQEGYQVRFKLAELFAQIREKWEERRK